MSTPPAGSATASTPDQDPDPDPRFAQVPPAQVPPGPTLRVGAPVPGRGFDAHEVRTRFPLLTLQREPPLVYLDSAATAQKPESVLAAMDDFYRRYNANIHRGIYAIAEEATAAYEDARLRVARFIGATAREVVFTRNSTEAINLVAYAWGRSALTRGDAIVLTEMEHHANLVPWQILAAERGIELRFLPITDDGELVLEALPGLLVDGRVRMVGVVHLSNVLGTVNPVAEIARQARAAGALTLVDASQSVPHMPVDVRALDCDFLVCTGHKMLGPTGIGVLWGRRELLEAMPPFLGGGEMIREVKLTGSKWNELPWKFEAGTMPIAEAVGLRAAVAFLEELGMEAVFAHDRALVALAYERLREIPGLRILGPGPERRGGVLAFDLAGIHPHDVATVLDHHGVAVRAGHHCAMPLHDRLGVHASARASFHCYSVPEDVDALVAGLHHARGVFG